MKHTRTHIREKPYTCSQCHIFFTDKTNLTRLTRTHTREKPCKCSLCGMDIHTGERLYICLHCAKGWYDGFIMLSDREYTLETCPVHASRSILNTQKPQICSINVAKHWPNQCFVSKLCIGYISYFILYYNKFLEGYSFIIYCFIRQGLLLICCTSKKLPK